MESASNVFDRLRKQAEAQMSKGNGGGFYSNENLLKLKIGEKYRLRLLWIPAPKGVNRENPMINQYVHRFWDNNAIGSKNIEVYCKTSQYDEGETRAGWDCPVCKEMSNIYKEYSNSGSKSAKEIYDTFRRTFRGYVPVYIINGPEEEVGKIKILQFTKSFKDFFDKHIFGFDKDAKDNKVDEEDILSINAFTYYEPADDTVKLEAYDFVVTVGSKTIPIRGRSVQVPDYKFDFKHNKSEIDFGWGSKTVEKYLNLSEELNFDKDFLKFSTTEELKDFLNKYVKNSESSTDNDDDISNDINEEVENPHINKIKEIAKETSKKINVKKEEEEDEGDEIKKSSAAVKNDDIEEEMKDFEEKSKNESSKDESSKDDEDDINLDDLLKDL